jgi:galactokinase
MDQTVALLAEEGSALLIHTRDFRTEPVQLGLAEAGLDLWSSTPGSSTPSPTASTPNAEPTATRLPGSWALPGCPTRPSPPSTGFATRGCGPGHGTWSQNQRVEAVVELVRAAG